MSPLEALSQGIFLHLRDLHARLAPLRGERLRLEALLERNAAEIAHIEEQLAGTEKAAHRNVLKRKQTRLAAANATYEQLRGDLQRLIDSTDTLLAERQATLMRLAAGNPDSAAAYQALQIALKSDDSGFERQWRELGKRMRRVVL